MSRLNDGKVWLVLAGLGAGDQDGDVVENHLEGGVEWKRLGRWRAFDLAASLIMEEHWGCIVE